MDTSQLLSVLRSSIRERASITMNSNQGKGNKKQSKAVKEAIDATWTSTVNAALAAIDETFRQLERKSVMETMSAVNSPIQEQDEPEDGNDNTLSADEESIAQLLTSNHELLATMNGFQLAESRHKKRKELHYRYQGGMDWLDEILATAKEEFATADIVCLPKTPAAKRKRKALAKKEKRSSIAAVIERPTGRPTRAAKSKAISKLTTSVSEEPAAEPSSANAADGVVTEQTKIVSSVPKKIARFSHLSHVKDKVDAFEKYSDSPATPAEKKSAIKKLIRSNSKTSTPRSGQRSGLKHKALTKLTNTDIDTLDLDVDEMTPVVDRTVPLTSTPGQSSASGDGKNTLTKLHIPAVHNRDTPTNSDSFSDVTPETVKKISKTQPALKITAVTSVSKSASSVTESSPLLKSASVSSSIAADSEPASTLSAAHSTDGADCDLSKSDQATLSVSLDKTPDADVSHDKEPTESQSKTRTSSRSAKQKCDSEPTVIPVQSKKDSEPRKKSTKKVSASTEKVSAHTEHNTSDRSMEIEHPKSGVTTGPVVTPPLPTTEPEHSPDVDLEISDDQDTDKDDSVFEPAEVPMDIPSKSPDIVDSDQKESSDASSAPELTDVEKPVLPAEKPDRVTRTKSRQLTTTSNSSTSDNKTTQSAAVTNASTVSTSIVSTGSVSAVTEGESLPQRMTRSKMRPAPPSVSSAAAVSDDHKSTPSPPINKSTANLRAKSPARAAPSPARAKSPARTQLPARVSRIPSNSDISAAPASMKRKPLSDSNPACGGAKRARTSSESSSGYGSSHLVKTMTKAASVSRINRTSGLGGKLHTAISTPDMNRTHSMVKSMLKPGRTSPQHTPSFGRTMLSFIKRATPQKTVTKEGQLEIKEQKLKEKQEAEKQRLQEAEKQKLQQAEAKRREREEKMKKVKEARQAKIKERETKQKEMEIKSQQKTESTNSALEKKIREEKDRALAREQKLMEAEERRKKDEELRLKKLRANEAEQKRVAEALARKKEYEEADRQRKIESDRQKMVEKAKQEALRKMTEQRMMQGKTPLPSGYTPQSSTAKTSIYEVISGKNAALAEERNTLMSAAKQYTSQSATNQGKTPLSSNKNALNSTFTREEKVNSENYIDIRLVEEDDEFEDAKFRKCKKPSWAESKNFNATVVIQYKAMASSQLDAKQVFGDAARCMPDLTQIFSVHKARFFKRGSSAMWASPPMRQSRRLSKKPNI